MGRKSKVEAGQWFGMWQVFDIANVEQTGTNKKVLCRCGNCGHTKLVFTNNLLSGKSSQCTYCRDHRSPEANRFEHPKMQNIKVGTVIGSLTITKVLPDARRTVEAKCLCGNVITRRVDVILRDEFPTCHHCRKNGTIYQWPLKNNAVDNLSTVLVEAFAEHHGYRWFDMTKTPPVEHTNDRYIGRKAMFIKKGIQ